MNPTFKIQKLKFLFIALATAAILPAQDLKTLTAIPGADVVRANDYLPLIDASADGLKKLTIDELWNALGGTSVSAAELGYLDGVTSAIQTQLNGKAGLTADQSWTGENTFDDIFFPSLETAYTANLVARTGLTYNRYLQLPDKDGILATVDDVTDGLARANHTGTQAWSTLTATPTTLSGYGITDAATFAQGAKADTALQAAGIGGVRVTGATGIPEFFLPSADTDTARGLALEAAFADSDTIAGTTIDLSPGNYLISKAYSGATVGGFVSDFAILDKMTIRLNGARLYRTTPATVTAGSFVVGQHYTIITAGTTSFTSEQGTANNNSGTGFVAIATGTGTGTAIPTPPVMFSVAHVVSAMGGIDWSLLGPGIIEGTAATTTTTGYTNEIAVNVNASRRWRIDGISFIKFRGTGLQLNSANFTGDVSGYGALKYSTGHVSNCNFDLCNIALGAYAANEFSTFTNCTFNQNLTGVDLYAGNLKFLGCDANGNTNFALRIRNGGNDGHGVWIGGEFAHNAGFAFSAEASMDNGFHFVGTLFGGDGSTSNKLQSLGGGVSLIGCYVESPFYASATPTGINVMKNCFIAGTYTVITDLSAAERAKWKFQNNHTLTGVWASDDIFTTYADDTAAGTGGVLAGEAYQVTGTGVMMIKQ